MGKDHTALVELNIFKCLREGDGSNDHPIKKVWGKKGWWFEIYNYYTLCNIV